MGGCFSARSSFIPSQVQAVFLCFLLLFSINICPAADEEPEDPRQYVAIDKSESHNYSCEFEDIIISKAMSAPGTVSYHFPYLTDLYPNLGGQNHPLENFRSWDPMDFDTAVRYHEGNKPEILTKVAYIKLVRSDPNDAELASQLVVTLRISSPYTSARYDPTYYHTPPYNTGGRNLVTRSDYQRIGDYIVMGANLTKYGEILVPNNYYIYEAYPGSNVNRNNLTPENPDGGVYWYIDVTFATGQDTAYVFFVPIDDDIIEVNTSERPFSGESFNIAIISSPDYTQDPDWTGDNIHDTSYTISIYDNDPVVKVRTLLGSDNTVPSWGIDWEIAPNDGYGETISESGNKKGGFEIFSNLNYDYNGYSVGGYPQQLDPNYTVTVYYNFGERVYLGEAEQGKDFTSSLMTGSVTLTKQQQTQIIEITPIEDEEVEITIDPNLSYVYAPENNSLSGYTGNVYFANRRGSHVFDTASRDSIYYWNIINSFNGEIAQIYLAPSNTYSVSNIVLDNSSNLPFYHELGREPYAIEYEGISGNQIYYWSGEAHRNLHRVRVVDQGGAVHVNRQISFGRHRAWVKIEESERPLVSVNTVADRNIATEPVDPENTATVPADSIGQFRFKRTGGTEKPLTIMYTLDGDYRYGEAADSPSRSTASPSLPWERYNPTTATISYYPLEEGYHKREYNFTFTIPTKSGDTITTPDLNLMMNLYGWLPYYSPEVGAYVYFVTFPVGYSEVDMYIFPEANYADDQEERIVLTIVPGREFPDANGIYGLKRGPGLYVRDEEASQATVNILEPPKVSISATNPVAYENGDSIDARQGEFTIFRTGDISRELEVRYNITGTATAGADYYIVPNEPYAGYIGFTGQVTFAVGQSSISLKLLPRQDNEPEGEETVTLTIVQHSNALYRLAANISATVTIQDDPSSVQNVNLAVLQAQIYENDASSIDITSVPPANINKCGRYRISRDNAMGNLTVFFRLTGTATPSDPLDGDDGNIGGDDDDDDDDDTAEAQKDYKPNGDYSLHVFDSLNKSLAHLTTITGAGNTKQVIIPNGYTSIDIIAVPVDDRVVENLSQDETIIITLESSATYKLSADTDKSRGIVYIRENDAIVTLTPESPQCHLSGNTPAFFNVDCGGSPQENMTFNLQLDTNQSDSGLNFSYFDIYLLCKENTSTGVYTITSQAEFLQALADGESIFDYAVKPLQSANNTITCFMPAGISRIDIALLPLSSKFTFTDGVDTKRIFFRVTEAGATTGIPLKLTNTVTALPLTIYDKQTFKIQTIDAICSEEGDASAKVRISRVEDSRTALPALTLRIQVSGDAGVNHPGIDQNADNVDYIVNPSLDLVAVGGNVCEGTVTIPAGAKYIDLIIDGILDEELEETETVRFTIIPDNSYKVSVDNTASIQIMDGSLKGDNTRPVIYQGPTVDLVGKSIILTGLAYDENALDQLYYVWTLESKPEGSVDLNFTPNNDTSASRTIAAIYDPGEYVFRLTVYDYRPSAANTDVSNLDPKDPRADGDGLSTTAKVTFVYTGPDPQDPYDAEFQTFVHRFYLLVLNRTPQQIRDDSARLVWIKYLQSGQYTGYDIAYGFFNSPEFSQRNVSDESFATICYNTFFDRAPVLADPSKPSGSNNRSELDAYLQMLKLYDEQYVSPTSGWLREDVMYQFVFSAEFSAVCAKFGIINHNEEQATLFHMRRMITEYFHALMNRRPSDADMVYWTDQLYYQKMRGSLFSLNFISNSEFIGRNLSNDAFVNSCYKAFFNPPAGTNISSNAAGYLNMLDNQGLTRLAVANQMLITDAFITRCINYSVVP